MPPTVPEKEASRPAKERRKEDRMGLSLPLRVQGRDPNGTVWEEMTTSDDASFGGASFILKHAADLGQALRLSLPLPKRFRKYDFTNPSYHVYAVVRGIKLIQPAARLGVMFLGKDPPKDHEENPAARYLLPSDPPPERRQHRRVENVFLNLRLRRTKEGAAEEEQTVAENLSKGGARVMTMLKVSKGEIVSVEEMRGDFRTRAEIRNVYVGKDNIPRLNLRFLDGEAPDRLVSAG